VLRHLDPTNKGARARGAKALEIPINWDFVVARHGLLLDTPSRPRSHRSAHALAGRQVSGMAEPLGGAVVRWWRRQGAASRRPPGGLPRDDPGAELHEVGSRLSEGCPRAAARTGDARSTGCRTSPAWLPSLSWAARHGRRGWAAPGVRSLAHGGCPFTGGPWGRGVTWLRVWGARGCR